jgi:transposase
MVSETVGKLLEGIDNKSGKKAVKYSIAFDGLLPCHSDVFTAAGYASEDMALPEAIMGHVKKDDGHRNIYVVDRGLQSTRVMKAFNDQKVAFIARAKENRKFVELESFMGSNQELDLGESILLRDCKVQSYTGVTINNKRGNKHSREVLSEGHFRLVVVESKALAGKTFWFLTNDFESPAKEIALAYRRRWDIDAVRRRGILPFLKTGIECKPLGFFE